MQYAEKAYRYAFVTASSKCQQSMMVQKMVCEKLIHLDSDLVLV